MDQRLSARQPSSSASSSASPSGPIYLDHAASSATRPAALEAFVEEARQMGNPSSLHQAGQRAAGRFAYARELVAAELGVTAHEVIFTSGGTEANNLALNHRRAQVDLTGARHRVARPDIEHPAILEPGGVDPISLPVSRTGLLHVEAAVETVLAADPAPTVVTVMTANNETGAIQPVGEFFSALRSAFHECGKAVPRLHTDAIAAGGRIPLSLQELAADTLALSGHKFGAPPGSGVLIVRRGIAPLTPLITGGGQQRGLRSGTIDVPGAIALATALREAGVNRQEETERMRALADRLARHLLAEIPGSFLSCELPAHQLLPGFVHLVIPGANSEILLAAADLQGVACSAGSACAAGVARPSHVLMAQSLSQADAQSALRLTLGWNTTEAEIDRACEILPRVAAQSRT